MKKIWYIGLLSIGLVACSTVGKAPVDDAYYWPEKVEVSQSSPTSSARPTSTPSQPAQQPVQTGPSIRYTNVQDTTVTIRIKK